MLQKLAITLISLGITFTLYNWLMLYLSWRTGRLHSAIPLVGGFPLSVGLLWFPATRLFAWVPLVLDWGTLGFLLALPQIVDELWSTSRFNLLEEYVGQEGRKTVQLRLFRKGVFTLWRRFQRPEGECGLSLVGAWKREEDRLLLMLNGDSATLKPLADTGYDAIFQTSGFRGDTNDEFSMAGMELRLKYRRTA